MTWHHTPEARTLLARITANPTLTTRETPAPFGEWLRGNDTAGIEFEGRAPRIELCQRADQCNADLKALDDLRIAWIDRLFGMTFRECQTPTEMRGWIALDDATASVAAAVAEAMAPVAEAA